MNRPRVIELRGFMASLLEEMFCLETYEYSTTDCDTPACVAGWTLRKFATAEKQQYVRRLYAHRWVSPDAWAAYRDAAVELLGLARHDPLDQDVADDIGQPFEPRKAWSELSDRELALARLDALLALPEGGV